MTFTPSSTSPERGIDAEPFAARAHSLPELVWQQARRTPNATALIFDGPEPEGRRTLSYAELHRRAQAVAHRLRSWNVGPERIVAVAGARSPELLAGILGVMEAGGAYLPIEPDDPPGRIRYILEDSNPAVILLDPDSMAGLGLDDTDIPTLHLGSQAPISEGRAAGPISPEPSVPTDGSSDPTGESRLAYLLYTSGSSGRPKGVMVEHGSIVNRIRWALESLPLDGDDIVLQKTPLGFDVSVPEIFWPLASGAPLVLPGSGGHRDPAYLADLTEREEATVLHFVPNMLRSFLEVDGIGTKCRTVRHVLACGEALPFDLTRLFYDLMPPEATLYNQYGPTEGTVNVTHWPVPREPSDEVVRIGWPSASAELHVLGENGEPLEPEAEGELHIGGVPVARGYLNQPDLTAEKFVPDPFSDAEGARLYRTGDRARWREDGTLEFLGRIDRQVQVQGVRSEPGEVEAALRRIPGVREAVVVPRADNQGELRLAAYIVPEDGGTAPDASHLRRILSEELPSATVPSTFTEIPELPLGPTEKVDVSQLPAPGSARPDLTQAYAPPRDDLERFLATTWSEILGIDRVGVDDRFFELGGTSRQAARVVHRVAERVKEPVYVATLFEAPTVAEYAALIRREYNGGRGTSGSPRGADGEPARTPPVDSDALERFRAAVPRYLDPSRPLKRRQRNPPALFILAPPRSGTTLLRVMLAGHSKIFAAPELQLLGFETLQKRREAFSGKQAHWLDGTVRTLMDLKDLGPDAARDVMGWHEAMGFTTRRFFRLLQRWAHPRLLADKTPAYALDPEALRRAENEFHNPLYVHLVRHPVATARSFQEQRLDQLVHLHEHDFTPAQLAELVWLESHRNTTDFLETVPEERWIRIRFEDLVDDPAEVLRALCDRIGLPYEPEMADPYRNLDDKMVDGVHPESTAMGDPKLLRRKRVDRSVARRHLDELTGEEASDLTWELAGTLGYERPGDHAGTERARIRRGRMRSLASRGKSSADRNAMKENA